MAARLADESKALYRNRWKSAAALSRFLSGRGWLLGPLIVMVRAYLLSQLQLRGRGRRPDLQKCQLSTFRGKSAVLMAASPGGLGSSGGSQRSR